LSEGYVGTLYDYVARAYDPGLGRFISADTIVPGAGNPAAFNRYMYVLGNPIRLSDPTGHKACADQDDCEPRTPPPIIRADDQNVSIWGAYRALQKTKVGGELINLVEAKGIIVHVNYWVWDASMQDQDVLEGQYIRLTSQYSGKTLAERVELLAHELLRTLQRALGEIPRGTFTTKQAERMAFFIGEAVRFEVSNRTRLNDNEVAFLKVKLDYQSGVKASYDWLAKFSGVSGWQYRNAPDGTSRGGMTPQILQGMGFSQEVVAVLFDAAGLPDPYGPQP
jgi:RHS repeat-associated protein